MTWTKSKIDKWEWAGKGAHKLSQGEPKLRQQSSICCAVNSLCTSTKPRWSWEDRCQNCRFSPLEVVVLVLKKTWCPVIWQKGFESRGGHGNVSLPQKRLFCIPSGPGKVVCIDETHITKRKHNAGGFQGKRTRGHCTVVMAMSELSGAYYGRKVLGRCHL